MSATKRSARAVGASSRRDGPNNETRPSLFRAALPLPLIPLVFALLAALLGLSDDSCGESAKRGDGIVEILLDVSPDEFDDAWPGTSPDLPFVETLRLGIVSSGDRVPLPNLVARVPRSEIGIYSRRLWRGRGFVRGPPPLG